ncbi:MAG: hypothetical protein HPAVJP_3160 [Candidatus Hepatoplasma vulgare]|nr:MAG: hypothetical protein HPAVJP_3160 [Candidatus Hepatoplasma sp.]
MKKLNLNKYAFLFYIKGDFYCWIQNNENFLNLAKRDEELKKIAPWRYKSLIKEKINDFEIPGPILDGLDVSKYSKIYFKKKYPELEIINLENESLEKAKNITNKFLEEKNNFIIFEAVFTYNEFTIKTDVLIKNNNTLYLIEVKGVTQPFYYHALDIMFQYKILKSLKYKINKKNLSLLILNNNYIYYKKSSIENTILNLFLEVKYFYNSRVDLTNYSNNINKQFNIYDVVKEEEYFSYFNFFDLILEKIKNVQLLEEPPISIFKKENFRGMNSDYESYYLKLKGAGEENSIFKYSGDSWFSKWKKALLFEEGFKTIESIENKKLISKNKIKKLEPEIMSWISKNPQNIIPDNKKSFERMIIEENANTFKRIIQRNSYMNKHTIFFEEKIKKFLNNFKKVIYMFDFETVQNSIPRIYETSPYEQVPYQYSIHVILDKDNFDFYNMKNVIHLEWLATEKDFYDEFWKNFLNDIQKYGEGSYVSFNKSFENMIIKRRIQKMIYGDPIYFMEKLIDETIDLMIPFYNKWYYHNDFEGRYSIKVIAPHFAPELNYKDLDSRVQKGDQSAKQCKIWLMNENEKIAEKTWKDVRKSMLKYCMYDTLSMVVIFQRLQELVKYGVVINNEKIRNKEESLWTQKK